MTCCFIRCHSRADYFYVALAGKHIVLQLGMWHDEVSGRKKVEVAIQKSSHGIGGGTDDRFLVHVETCVDERRDASALEVAAKDSVVARISFLRYQLWPSGTINMHCRRAH